MCLRSTMPSNLLDPCPCNWNRPFMVSQPNHQQLVGKTNFHPIHNQTDLLKMPGLHFQPAASNWLVPISDIYRRVGHKPAHALDQVEQLHLTRYLSRNSAQSNRAALVDPHNQPDKIPDTRFSFGRSQLSNSHVPSKIEIVDRHGLLLFLIWQEQVFIYRADQSFLLKVDGG